MKKHLIIKVITICIVIIAIVLLAPFLYVSKFAYPWADDFGYSYASRLAFVRDGSIIGAIAEAFRELPDRYMGWQGLIHLWCLWLFRQLCGTLSCII